MKEFLINLLILITIPIYMTMKTFKKLLEYFNGVGECIRRVYRYD